MTRATGHDLVEVLRDERRRIERTSELLQGGADGARERLVADLLSEVWRHARSVRDHLDPLVRRYLPDGAARSDRQLSEHRQIERVVGELRRHRPGDVSYDELLGRLISQLRNHLAEQEREMLPRLREHVPADVLAQRGRLALHR